MTVGFFRHSIRTLAPLYLALLEGSALVLGGCAGEPDGSAPTSAQADPLQRARWGRFAPRPVAPGTLPPPANGADAGIPTTDPNAGVPQQDASAIIAAARTPDGSAIPQPAGPNGECPPVVVLLGFWSCPTLEATCSYAANGVTHACSCDRVDGEGQTPAWVCE
jgi:hypothetical protein